MKTRMADWCSQVQELIPSITTGSLSSEVSQPFTHGTYLEVWWRCLRVSKEFLQSSRSGIFKSDAAYNTYCMFGSLENMTFKEWWLAKGHLYFSESITSLQVSFLVNRKDANAFSLTVDAYQNVPIDLASKEFNFWLSQIYRLNAKDGLLSDAPLAWPIFQSRITCEAIAQLLTLVEVHDQIIRNAPGTKLWQIGEQMKLNPKAMPKNSDYPTLVSEKHKMMGQTVSNYLKKGKALVNNASNGCFPKFD